MGQPAADLPVGQELGGLILPAQGVCDAGPESLPCTADSSCLFFLQGLEAGAHGVQRCSHIKQDKGFCPELGTGQGRSPWGKISGDLETVSLANSHCECYKLKPVSLESFLYGLKPFSKVIIAFIKKFYKAT